ncbi:MarC family protein [Roseomonas xinghualingensis]|uniref:MarC family protein n=1 Tax=Roseomonas xinghualingensis TaxID=2986475 RepID=UPI0021F1CB1E|nr:MarC family protein [Roseomonas sp. SXEYE001]MCV4209444.1 MarC family protein [Roseomonas sp. SXEYE001]
MSTHFLLSTFITLLVTVDPVGTAQVFMSLTGSMTHQDRRFVAVRSMLLSFLILVFFALAGQRLFAIMGIGMPAFRIAGGLLLFWIAFQMVFAQTRRHKEEEAEKAARADEIRDIAVFPLAIPMTAGPGSITAVILVASRAEGHILTLASLVVLVGIVILICLALCLASERVSRLLGRTGNLVLSRLLGVLLTALAVEFVTDGIRASLAPHA